MNEKQRLTYYRFLLDNDEVVYFNADDASTRQVGYLVDIQEDNITATDLWHRRKFNNVYNITAYEMCR